MNPSIFTVQNWNLFGSVLTFGVTMARWEYIRIDPLRDGSPEESTCIGPGKVHRNENLTLMNWSDVPLTIFADNDSRVRRASFQLFEQVVFQFFIGRVVIAFGAIFALGIDNLLLIVPLQHPQQRLQDGLDLVSFGRSLLSVVLVIVDRVVRRDDVFVCGVHGHDWRQVVNRFVE